MNRGQLPARLLPTHPRGDGPERMSGRITICRNTPSHIMSPTRSQPGSSAEVSLGVRGHTPAPQRAHAPPPAGVPPASMPAGDTLTHTNHHPAEALDNQTTGQVSSSAASSRRSACASSGQCSRPPRAARQLSAGIALVRDRWRPRSPGRRSAARLEAATTPSDRTRSSGHGLRSAAIRPCRRRCSCWYAPRSHGPPRLPARGSHEPPPSRRLVAGTAPRETARWRLADWGRDR